jgi:hypothetical protein
MPYLIQLNLPLGNAFFEVLYSTIQIYLHHQVKVLCPMAYPGPIKTAFVGSSFKMFWTVTCIVFFHPFNMFSSLVSLVWNSVCNIINLYLFDIWGRKCRKHYSYLRGPFGKFVDSPYYSESELCGGAVTVSFSKYLPWQAIHLLQWSTHFAKTCCRPFAASFRRIVEQAVLTFHVSFSVSKALPPLENRSSSHCIVSIGLVLLKRP